MLILVSWPQQKTDLAVRGMAQREARVVRVVVRDNGQMRQVTITLPIPPAPTDEDNDRPTRPVQPINLNSAAVDRENFDQWLFPDGYSATERQKHLDDILEEKIKAAARKQRLTAPQRAKLRLAGRGDIKRFFDQVEDRRREFEKDRQTFRTGLASLRGLTDLAHHYQVGPFGDGSLFAKTLQKIEDDRKAGRQDAIAMQALPCGLISPQESALPHSR
jgi:hypothetical protein